MNAIVIQPVVLLSHEQIMANYILKTKHYNHTTPIYPRYNKCELCDQEFITGDRIACFENTYYASNHFSNLIEQKAHKRCLDFKCADSIARGFWNCYLVPIGKEYTW